MKIYLNNEPQEVESKVTLSKVLQHHSLLEKGGIAVALNNVVIPKANWFDQDLSEDDEIMVITATAGG